MGGGASKHGNTENADDAKNETDLLSPIPQPSRLTQTSSLESPVSNRNAKKSRMTKNDSIMIQKAKMTHTHAVTTFALSPTTSHGLEPLSPVSSEIKSTRRGSLSTSSAPNQEEAHRELRECAATQENAPSEEASFPPKNNRGEHGAPIL